MEKRLQRDGARPPDELCIRFLNTVAWRLREPQEDRLSSPDALLGWLGASGLADETYARRLRSAWTRQPEKGAEVHGAALALREAIYAIFRARIEGEAARAADLAQLNGWLARPAPGVTLAPRGAQIAWRPSSRDADPLDLLRPIALSAADLITGPRAKSIRQCADDRGCGWLFVDESRAQNRRWCAMGDCGNRAKATRHRARKKAARAEVAS
jgi:predicted RNA-binding Zn ribbon-like protein